MNHQKRLKLKINAKSLAYESKANRHECRKIHGHYRRIGKDVSNDDTWGALEHHRKWKLRTESRAVHLVRAFLAGRPYREVEPNADWANYKWAITLRAIEDKCKRWRIKSESIMNWMNDALVEAG